MMHEKTYLFLIRYFKGGGNPIRKVYFKLLMNLSILFLVHLKLSNKSKLGIFNSRFTWNADFYSKEAISIQLKLPEDCNYSLSRSTNS